MPWKTGGGGEAQSNLFELLIIFFTYIYACMCACVRVCVRGNLCTALTLWLKTTRTRKEGNILFNDALSTLFLRLYGVGHMVEDHSDSERGNPLPPHGLLFPISSKGSFICTIPQTGYHIPQTFVTPVVEHWLERTSLQRPSLQRHVHHRVLCKQTYTTLILRVMAEFGFRHRQC